ncbi:MAG: lipid asymmetry maintenance ABC transporter permease subunit MlaE [Gammaproteobacteria bacterium]
MRRVLTDVVFAVQEWLETFGASQLFLMRILAGCPRALLRPSLIIRQVYASGVLSLAIIGISGLFVGMVLALQGYNSLERFGATESLGVVAALALVRELGPVVTALLFAGRAGTALASEIGLMRATDQLSGMEMMAVDPVRRVVVPRFLGGIISMPLLAAIFSAMGIFGAWLIGVVLLGVDEGSFWSSMRDQVDYKDDVLSGVLKSFVFGIAASLLAVFEGYNSIPTAEGVSRATTRTVVLTALSVLILNFMLTAVLLGEV